MEVNQPIGVFFLSVMPAKVILNVTEIRRKKDGKGIQREASQKRIKEISQYCSDVDATFPTPIIIAIDDIPSISVNESTLEFNENEIIGEVIDGQHRLLGIKRSANIEQFMLPVVLMFSLTEEEKAYIFSIINSTQTKVPMSLIYELFDVAEKRSPQKTCHEVARLLNSKENSPFYKRLKMLGKKEGDLSSLSQGSFVKYLMPLISKKPDEDARILKRGGTLQPDSKCPLRNYFINDEDEKIFIIMFNLFSAIKNVFPEEWEDHRRYILSKTTGYGAVMKSFPDLYEIGIRKRKLSIDFFIDCFTNFKDELYDMDYELTSEYFASNEQEQRRLKEVIIQSQKI